jgi:hypothetical protein
MSVLVPFNGSQYIIPTSGETGWATPVTNLLSDLGNNAVSLTQSQALSNKTIQFSAGSAGSPAISFVGDTDTGIFHPAVNQVAIATNGTQQLLVDGSGNVTLTNTLSTSDNSQKLATTSFVQSAVATTVQNVGRNKLHNSLFQIAQRGAGAFTTSVYTLDRWLAQITLDTASFSQVALADADRTAIGDEEALYCLQNVFTGNAGGTALNVICQRIENVRKLSGKTVTVSFWAKANSGTPKVGVSIDQAFGTGGSPSLTANGNGNALTISAAWTRYSTTIAVPSTSGKTLGTNNDHFTQLNIWYSSGSSSAGRSGSIGVQSGTIQLWGVQLEVGSAASPLEKSDYQQELAKCQRFYVSSGTGAWTHYGYIGGVQSIQASMSLPVPMRATPSLVNFNFTTSTNVTTPTIGAQGATMLVMAGTGAGAGPFGLQSAWNATADL